MKDATLGQVQDSGWFELPDPDTGHDPDCTCVACIRARDDILFEWMARGEAADACHDRHINEGIRSIV